MSAATAQGGFFSISGRQWLILLMVQLSNMLFGMTITLANLVLPQIRGTFSATQDEISWVITLNLVATAIATPMTGWLSSRLGWRNLMFFTVLGFTVSSFLCGMANSLETLILARVAQGLFGAPIMPMGQAVLLATFPPHLQPAALMMWGVGAVFGPVVGPIVGAIATEAYNWRAAFFMIVPPGICALVCIWFALAEHSKPSAVSFDWIGFIALSVAIVAAQLIFDRGQRLDWFDSREITLCALRRRARLLGLRRALPDRGSAVPEPAPAARPQLRRRHPDRLRHGHAELHEPGAVSEPAARPARLSRQHHRHADRGARPRQLDGLLLHRAADAHRPALRRRQPGLASRPLGGFWMAQFDINLTEFDVFWSHFLMGLGQSVAFTPMTLMAFATLPRHQLTEGAAVFTMMRNFGSSLFISLAVLVLVRSTTINYARMTEFITPYRKELAFPGLPELWNVETATGLLRLSNEIQRQAAMIGYVNAFYLMAFTALAALPLACLLRSAARGR